MVNKKYGGGEADKKVVVTTRRCPPKLEKNPLKYFSLIQLLVTASKILAYPEIFLFLCSWDLCYGDEFQIGETFEFLTNKCYFIFI